MMSGVGDTPIDELPPLLEADDESSNWYSICYVLKHSRGEQNETTWADIERSVRPEEVV